MIRDTYSNALLATDIKELDKYRIEKARTRQIEQLHYDIEDLRKSIQQIHSLLVKRSTEEK